MAGRDDPWTPIEQPFARVDADDEPCQRDELGAPLLLDDLAGPGDRLG
ncbi:MAG: hypothetical protein AB7H43_15750 [Acidimicrobiia bacterium]